MKTWLKEAAATALLILWLAWHAFVVGDLNADFDQDDE